MLVLIGPSASGKTETAKYLMDHMGLKKVITCTSRKPRVGEVDGIDYHFLTRQQFEEGIEKHEFLETAEYNGNLYGTKFADLGDDKVVCIEPIGAHSYRRALGKKFFLVYLDADEATRRKRMIDLRKDGEKAAIERLTQDRKIFADGANSPKKMADFVIKTDHMSIAQDADKIYQAYLEWKNKRSI